MTEGEGFDVDNNFFKSMLDLLPAKVYFDRDIQEKVLSRKTEVKGGEQNGIAHTNEDRTDKSSPNKRKKSKKNKKEKKSVDPFMKKSVSQIQEEELVIQPQKKFTEIKHKKRKLDNTQFIPSTTPVASGSGNIDDNREKLRTKIEQLEAKRNASDKNSLENKRLQRLELKKRKKAKRQALKKANSAKVQSNEAAKGDNSNKQANKTPTKPIYNKDGDLVFSKFDFTSSGKKKHKSDLTGKDYKRLLEKIEKRNEKLKDLKNKDESAAVNLKEKFKWDAALHKAEGEKVKDNPELLKKALKRKEKIREKKKQKWGERTKEVEKKIDAKQAKRTKNLNARIQKKKDTKMKKLIKKGRSVPGF